MLSLPLGGSFLTRGRSYVCLGRSIGTSVASTFSSIRRSTLLYAHDPCSLVLGESSGKVRATLHAGIPTPASRGSTTVGSVLRQRPQPFGAECALLPEPWIRGRDRLELGLSTEYREARYAIHNGYRGKGGGVDRLTRVGRYGAFLMEDWNLIGRLVSSLHRELSIPVTAKIRVFETVEKTVDYARMLVAAGAQVLTVHGRLRVQKGSNTVSHPFATARDSRSSSTRALRTGERSRPSRTRYRFP